MVPKSNRKLWMCMEYTDLNKACPNEPYPLLSIDSLVNSASRFHLLSFMVAYFGYNQIPMHLSDEEKTAFITPMANYCYKVMPFGLKNARSTYQRLMNKIFGEQIGKLLEVYIDNILVKTSDFKQLILDINLVFGCIKKHNIWLNSQKFAFVLEAGKFFGMLIHRDIEANPKKCKVILNMKSLTSVKEV